MTKPSIRRCFGVAAATMAALAATVVPASAASSDVSILINRTNCNQNDYFEIHNNNGRDTLCFANAGSMPVAIYGVNWIESGNNVVTFEFQRNLSEPRLETVTLDKWRSWQPGQPSIHRVTWIRIH